VTLSASECQKFPEEIAEAKKKINRYSLTHEDPEEKRLSTHRVTTRFFFSEEV
jgi:hypothetical protein